jgi:hypothetical protein
VRAGVNMNLTTEDAGETGASNGSNGAATEALYVSISYLGFEFTYQWPPAARQ